VSGPRPASVVGGIALCYVLAFPALLLFSILTAPADLLPSYRLTYALRSAAIAVIDNLPALTAAGAMVAYSLFRAREASIGRGGPSAMEAVIRPATVTLLVLTLAYVAATGLAAPMLRRGSLDMEQASAAAKAYKAEMEDAAGRAASSSAVEDYRAASEAASRYLEIDPENKEIADRQNSYQKLYIEARDAAAARDRAAARAKEASAQTAERGSDPVELLRKAQAFYDAGDFYSAHYYASLAQRSAEVRDRAAALVAAAERQISPSTVLADKATAGEVAAAELLKQKREAYALYEQADWVAAFYRFGDLAARYPDDRDIATYRELAKGKVLATAFPIGDAQAALRYPGVEGVLFVTDRGERGLEVVSIRKMVSTPAGTYFSDIELLRVVQGTGPTLHVFARYGKLSGATILLHAVDEEAAWRSEEPRVYLAKDPAELTVALDPGYAPEALEYIRPDPKALRAVPTGILWSMRAWAGRSGLLEQAVELEIVLFLVRPILFLAVGLGALAVAWRYRARYYGRPSVPAYLSLAAFPFAASGIWWLVVDAARLACGSLVVAAGFVPAAIAGASIAAVLVLVALVALARGATD
jgi:hypothetical protein